MKRLLRTLTILLAALATIFAVAGCSNSKAGDTQIDKEKVITVIASTNVWGSVAKQLGGRLCGRHMHSQQHRHRCARLRAFDQRHLQVPACAGRDTQRRWLRRVGGEGGPGQSKAIVIDAAAAGGKKTGDNPHVWFSAAVRNKTADGDHPPPTSKLMPSEKAEFEKLNKDWHTEEDDLEAQLRPSRRPTARCRTAP